MTRDTLREIVRALREAPTLLLKREPRHIDDILRCADAGRRDCDCTQFFPPPAKPKFHVMFRRADGSVVDPLTEPTLYRELYDKEFPR